MLSKVFHIIGSTTFTTQTDRTTHESNFDYPPSVISPLCHRSHTHDRRFSMLPIPDDFVTTRMMTVSRFVEGKRLRLCSVKPTVARWCQCVMLKVRRRPTICARPQAQPKCALEFFG